MELFIVAALGLLLSGCSTAKYPAKFPPELVPIVRSELNNRGWKKFEITSITEQNDRWDVFAVRLPEVPGGHCNIEIAKTNNTIIRVLPGL